MPEETSKTPSWPERAAGRIVECCCPGIVVYAVFTKCVTINNGACEDWKFCHPECGEPKATPGAV